MEHGPKILLLGDYSNCQRSLATGLRRIGCEVTLISDGSSWQDCQRDIDISRRPGKLGGLQLYLKLKYKLSDRLSGYDIVSIHDPNFVSLRPKLLKKIFDRLKTSNGSVFLNAMSTDLPFLDMLQDHNSPLKYSEWFVDGKPSRLKIADQAQWDAWHTKDLADYQRYVYSQLDGAVAVLYEYYLGLGYALPPEKIAYGGIPIDTEVLQPVALPEKIDCVKLFLGRDRMRKLVKGSDYLEEAARRVIARHPGKAELVIVENRPFAEFTKLLKNSHVVLDQIYSYTPATTALMAMAYGLNVVSGGESDYYDFIGEHDNLPVINAPTELDALTDTLEQIVTHPEQIALRGRKSREFVEKHNACEIVARRYLDFWTNRINRIC